MPRIAWTPCEWVDGPSTRLGQSDLDRAETALPRPISTETIPELAGISVLDRTLAATPPPLHSGSSAAVSNSYAPVEQPVCAAEIMRREPDQGAVELLVAGPEILRLRSAEPSFLSGRGGCPSGEHHGKFQERDAEIQALRGELREQKAQYLRDRQEWEIKERSLRLELEEKSKLEIALAEALQNSKEREDRLQHEVRAFREATALVDALRPDAGVTDAGVHLQAETLLEVLMNLKEAVHDEERTHDMQQHVLREEIDSLQQHVQEMQANETQQRGQMEELERHKMAVEEQMVRAALFPASPFRTRRPSGGNGCREAFGTPPNQRGQSWEERHSEALSGSTLLLPAAAPRRSRSPNAAPLSEAVDLLSEMLETSRPSSRTPSASPHPEAWSIVVQDQHNCTPNGTFNHHRSTSGSSSVSLPRTPKMQCRGSPKMQSRSPKPKLKALNGTMPKFPPAQLPGGGSPDGRRHSKARLQVPQSPTDSVTASPLSAGGDFLASRFVPTPEVQALTPSSHDSLSHWDDIARSVVAAMGGSADPWPGSPSGTTSPKNTAPGFAHDGASPRQAEDDEDELDLRSEICPWSTRGARRLRV